MTIEEADLRIRFFIGLMLLFCSSQPHRPKRGRIGGRPRALGEADLKKARALLRSGDYSRVQVAEDLGVSRHTLWRALSREPAA